MVYEYVRFLLAIPYVLRPQRYGFTLPNVWFYTVKECVAENVKSIDDLLHKFNSMLRRISKATRNDKKSPIFIATTSSLIKDAKTVPCRTMAY